MRFHNYQVVLATALLATAFAASASGQSDQQQSDMAAKAKVTMSQARATAMKTYQGKITKEELEKEKGGSGLRYSFDIKQGSTTHEVGVDAMTGKVLENSVENGADSD